MKEKYLNMKSNQSKEEGKEKEEAPKTPTYAAVVAPTLGTTAATKEDVATLRRIIEESGGGAKSACMRCVCS